MRWKRALFPHLVIILVISAISLLACGSQELTSTWRDREVTVDGLDAEWEGAVSYLEKENIAIGLLNDDEYLYVCLASIDFQRVGQLTRGGLTLWFDPQGSKKKSFGINFPLEMKLDPRNMKEEKMPMPISKEGSPDPEKLRQMLEQSTKEMVILGPGENDRRRMPVSESQEIQAKLGYSGGKLVYELRVPLIRDEQHPDAIGVSGGQTIGMGFETAEMDMEMDRDRMRDRMGGDMPPGGQGMPGGGMPGGGMRGGGMPGGRRPEGASAEKLKLWTKVELASSSLMESE